MATAPNTVTGSHTVRHTEMDFGAVTRRPFKVASRIADLPFSASRGWGHLADAGASQLWPVRSKGSLTSSPLILYPDQCNLIDLYQVTNRMGALRAALGGLPRQALLK